MTVNVKLDKSTDFSKNIVQNKEQNTIELDIILSIINKKKQIGD